jgi:hypothetical protein
MAKNDHLYSTIAQMHLPTSITGLSAGPYRETNNQAWTALSAMGLGAPNLIDNLPNEKPGAVAGPCGYENEKRSRLVTSAGSRDRLFRRENSELVSVGGDLKLTGSRRRGCHRAVMQGDYLP